MDSDVEEQHVENLIKKYVKVNVGLSCTSVSLNFSVN